MLEDMFIKLACMCWSSYVSGFQHTFLRGSIDGDILHLPKDTEN